MILARDKFPGSSISLDALCKRYRIDNSKRERHSALVDCDLLVKVYINLIDQKEPKLDFNKNDDLKKESYDKVIPYCKKIVSISDEEILNHKNYIKSSLKKNYF